jgi:hypothetical protein
MEGNSWIPSSHDRRYHCIFCEDDKYHLYISISKQVYHCFKCEASGKLEVEEKNSLSNYEKIINEWFNEGLVSDVDRGTYPKEVIKTLPRCHPSWIRHVGYDRVFYYLIKRGLTPEEIHQNGIMESKDRDGIYSGTAIFPVWNGIIKDDAEVDYFVCRKINPREGESKYINAPWPKEGTLYQPFITPYVSRGNILSSNQWGNILVICEGAFDAIRIARVAMSAALLGKKATTQQLEKIINLVKYPWNNALKEIKKEIMILLDPEAFSNAVKLQLELRAMGEQMGYVSFIKICTLPRGKDPGSSSEKLLKEALGL